ncbi:MAG: hypothetical protein JO303_12120, partial [Caulobacteraceae bacterium]|nr:hypothetical protein [Caulobacteraceae bacterium]
MNAQTMGGLNPLRCNAFLSSIGVNTHVGYVNSQYGDVSAVLDALRFVGVKYVRDGADTPDDMARYETMAAKGVSFCLFLPAKRSMADALAAISALEAARPGAVHALEGPNEIKPEFAYAGLVGNAAGQQFMVDLRARAAADDRLRRTPLVAFTSYQAVACECDFANHHPYPKAGAQPGTLLKTLHKRYVGPNGVMPGKAMVFTEFGYHTLVGPPDRPGAWQGVDPERQAVLIVNALFDNAAQGVTRTYIYQLLDGAAENGGSPNQEKHFGLFAYDGSPKPAAKALRTLFMRLEDSGAGARDFSLKPVEAGVSVTAPVACLALQNSTGQSFLAFWNESAIWNKDAAAPQD